MKLNLGCGNDYMEGYVNVDMGSCRCDVSHDLGVFPWPFEDSSVDEVVLKHIFEHFNPEEFITITRELYRICKDKAIIQIISPHAGSDNYWTDPTHKMPLTARTFDFFDRDKALFENGKIYGWDDVNFSVRARVLDNPPNGPDIYHRLEVNK
jgi:hypothetical protein